jgi:hypothetical protein
MGWPIERVIVIDSDLGQSGASAADREGFQRLVTRSAWGGRGSCSGLEVSRLARNSTDWHRLLELCALADTLILDEDGLYDPAHFNDRLLLGLKGTMSEAELHVIKARLRGGILSRARRGELKQMLPVGFVHDACKIASSSIPTPRFSRRCDCSSRPSSAPAPAWRWSRNSMSSSCCSRAAAKRPAQGRTRLVRTPALSSPPDHPQPTLCRSLRLRAHQAAPLAQWQESARDSCRASEWILLRDMHPATSRGRTTRPTSSVSGQRAVLERGATAGSAPGGHCAAAGAGDSAVPAGERMSVRYHSQRCQMVPTYWCGRRAMHRGIGPVPDGARRGPR